jgi:hypothetical protein
MREPLQPSMERKRPLCRQIVMGAAGIEPDRPVMH